MSEAALKTPARKPRPKYLSLQALLFEIRLPLPGWVSILHRVSGALLFVALVWLLWMLDRSLVLRGRLRDSQALRRPAGR